MMDAERKYSLSFTAASFRLHDFLRVATYFQNHSGPLNTADVNAEKVLTKGNQKTSNREMAEFIKRFNALTDTQKTLLIEGSIDEQKHVTFLAIVKSNTFIRDFVMEVIRDKFLVFDFQVSDADFRSFINRKLDLHPELENFADGTKEKARQTLFKILADAGIIDGIKTKNVQPQWLSPKFIKAVANDNPEFLKAFFLSEKDLNLALYDV